MERQFITDIIYVELNDLLGPHPVAWLSTQYSKMELIQISIKTLTLLTGEQGFVPKSLVILPFPSMNLKGLVKYIKWDDASRRGRIGQSAIILLFHDIDDVIFYKYIKELSIPFENHTQAIIKLEKSTKSKKDFIQILEHLEFNIKSLLEELKLQEISKQEQEEFPAIKIKDRTLIDYKFKIILVGDPNVGKTSLILRYTNNAFRRNYVPTLGVMVSDKVFKVDESIVQLALWDIGGQQKFQTMRQQFYEGCDAVFFVFDLTRIESFDNILKWHSDVIEQLKYNSPKLKGFIVGNKRDLADQRKVTSEMATELAEQIKMEFIETSALSGENVSHAFSTIAKYLFKSYV